MTQGKFRDDFRDDAVYLLNIDTPVSVLEGSRAIWVVAAFRRRCLNTWALKRTKKLEMGSSSISKPLLFQ